MFLLKKAAVGYVTEIMGHILYAFASFLLLLAVMFLLFLLQLSNVMILLEPAVVIFFLGNLRYI